MSEYLLDSGHHMMRTCDSCGGAFHCRAPSRINDTEDVDAPEWVCETCQRTSAQSKELADALEAARTAMGRGLEFGPKGRDRHVPSQVDTALRLVGRLP